MDSEESFSPSLVELDPTPTAVVRGRVAVADLPSFFDGAFARLGVALAELGTAPVGPAFALYHGEPGEFADLEVGFPLSAPTGRIGDVAPGVLPGGRVARVVHHGSFDSLDSSWQRLADWMQARELAPSVELWEVYLTEPSPDMDPAELRTELNWSLVG